MDDAGGRMQRCVEIKTNAMDYVEKNRNGSDKNAFGLQPEEEPVDPHCGCHAVDGFYKFPVMLSSLTEACMYNESEDCESHDLSEEDSLKDCCSEEISVRDEP